MQISLISATACLYFMAWLGQVQLISVDYKYKRRGPPPPPRPPPPPQYMKNWEHQGRPNRSPSRPRPVPLPIIADFMPPPLGPPIKPTVGPPPQLHFKPTPIPNRSHWKNTKIPLHTIPEKAFHSSIPLSNTHEFDYHIQTNNIPTHSIPIKQVDEKGPIHTIPAPNLSLADKPIVVEEVRKEVKLKPHYQQISQQIHQYQVTENNDNFGRIAQKHFGSQQIFFGQDTPTNLQNQNYEKAQQQSSAKLPILESYVNVPIDQLEASGLNSKELYQVLNSQLQPQQVYDNYEAPLLPQTLQKHPNQQIPFSDYQALLAQSQYFQPEVSYVNQGQQSVVGQSSRDINQHHFHSFGVERHHQSNFPNDEQSTFITTDYNMKAQDSESAEQIINSQANMPYIQEIFELTDENAAAGNGEQTDRDIAEPTNQHTDEDISAAYYASLPNQQAAETLASLQAAGKLNNNYLQITQQQSQNRQVKQRTPLEIYVPEGNRENASREKNTSTAELEDEDEEDADLEHSEDTNTTKYQTRGNTHFGNRIRPKKN